MLKIRFGVMLYQTNQTERAKSRLLAAIGALQGQLNNFGPSYWFEENFIAESGFYAGYYWFVSGSFGSYRLHLNDRPFEAGRPVARPSLSIVNS